MAGGRAFFDNPILTASRLIHGYRDAIGQSLLSSGMPEQYREQVLDGLQLGSGADLESTLWLTRRRPFVRDADAFINTAQQLGVSKEVAEAFSSTVDTLWSHQRDAIKAVLAGSDTIIATGTGSGKTEAFLIPVIEMCFRHQSTPGVKAIIVYPRNALVEDQLRRFQGQYLRTLPVTAAAYTGTVSEGERARVLRQPPDILLTNHVMLERILTRPERRVLAGAGTLEVVVLDELHTFRGNAGADTAWLLKRLTARSGTRPVFVGASATLDEQPSSHSGEAERNYGSVESVSTFARRLFSLGGAVGTNVPIALVRPSYLPEEFDAGEFPRPDWERLPGWHHDVSDHGALLVESFFGLEPQAVRGFGRLKPSFNLPERLAGHALIRAWKRLLLDPMQFSQLVEAGAATYLECLGEPCPDPRRLAETALQLIALDRNDVFMSGGRREPVMNLVTHIITRGLEGPLMVCVACGTHHVGPETRCPNSDCSGHLTLAFRDDPRRGLVYADATEHVLHPYRSASGDITPSTFLVSRETEAYQGLSRFTRVRLEQGAPGSSGYRFFPDEDGEYLIEQLGQTSVRGPRPLPIARTTLTRHNLEHFLDMTWQMLLVEGANPRLLVFANQRDRAAHVGYMLKADRTERYLSKMATNGLDVPVLLPAVPSQLSGVIESTEGSRELADAVPAWLARLCSTSPRLYPDHRESLDFSSLHEIEELSLCERRILDVCLMDGVIDWADVLGDVELPRHQAIFHYDRRWRTQHPRLAMEAGGTTDRRDRAVKLTDNVNATHHQLVEEFGAEAIVLAADSLVGKGWLLKGPTKAGLDGYRLAPERLMLGSRVHRLARDVTRYFGAGIHTSDADVESREKIERSFKDPSSGLAQISATSTLELGVDIGALQHVACYGIPPNPASFAQRAGRAGRGGAARYALVLTWAESWSETESRLVRDANELRTLLSGSALVPQIDPLNPSVARRHLFAETLATDWGRWGGSQGDLGECLRQASAQIPVDLVMAFGPLGFGRALEDTLLPWLDEQSRQGTGNVRNAFYESIHAPDYGFPRAMIGIADADFRSAPGMDQNRSDPTRAPNIAIRSFYPRALVRLPAGLGRIGEPAKCGVSIQLPTGRTIQRVQAFTVDEDRGGTVRLDETKLLYDVRCVIDAEPGQPVSASDHGWLRWQVDRAARMVIANLGPKDAGRSKATEESSDDADGLTGVDPLFAWGYEVVADALRLQFHPGLLDEESIGAVLGALCAAIQRQYALADEDFAVLPELNEDENGFTGRFAITDIGGRNLLPLHRLEDDFEVCIEDAYAVVQACACRDGCFRCVRAQATQYVFPLASKARAIDLLGALIGRLSFRPSLPARPAVSQLDQVASTTIRLRLCGSQGNQRIEWQSPTCTGAVPLIGQSEASGLLEALRQAVTGLAAGAITVLETNRDYLHGYLSGATTGNQIDPEWRWLGLKYRWVRARS